MGIEGRLSMGRKPCLLLSKREKEMSITDCNIAGRARPCQIASGSGQKTKKEPVIFTG